MFLRLVFLSVLLAWSAMPRARSAEPFLKPNDVIALVGGEDMVVAAEDGYLELLLQRGLPGYHLKVRSLAWEGDTVFEQQRDLNYPTLEQQLDDIGATVVIMQFGQMESLDGTSKLPEFIKAYEKLIERVKAAKRRVMVLTPTPFQPSSGQLLDSYKKDNREIGPGGPAAPLDFPVPNWKETSITRDGNNSAYRRAIYSLKEFADVAGPLELSRWVRTIHRDGVHLNSDGQSDFASFVADCLGAHQQSNVVNSLESDAALAAIRAKNRLWFHYYRPQNWAFLAGDRTEQPSSRDWKDPSKRWFPEEMKQYLPLIDQKEKEIWALAAKAAKP